MIDVIFQVDDDGVERVWIFTFGYGHRDPRTGRSLANCYCRVRGSYRGARVEMAEMFGIKWAFQYASEADAGVGRFEAWGVILREVDTGSRWGGYVRRLHHHR